LPLANQEIGCLFFAASLLVLFFAPLKAGHKGKQRNEQISNNYILYIFFFCLPLCPVFKGAKEEARKAPPRLSRPYRLPEVYAPLRGTSHCCRGVKKLGFASNSFNASFRQQLRCSAGQNGAPKNKT